MAPATLSARLPSTFAVSGVAVALALASPVAAHASQSSSPVSVPSPVAGVHRVAGLDRYLTGVQVSQSQWADAGGDTSGRAAAQAVVLARGDNFPDALSGVPLAAKVRGPLLLTDPGALTPVTADELVRVLGAGNGKPVYILGGPGAVSPGIEAQLVHSGYLVTRYSGNDRFATALDVARRGLGDPAHVIVATGDGFADALTAGPFAAGPDAVAGNPAAIVLSSGNTFDPGTAGYVRGKFQPTGGDCASVTAVGGKATTAVAAAAPAGTCSNSYSGFDRYATAQAVAGLFGPVHAIGVATGSAFADALTGGAAMAQLGQPLVLTAPDVLGENPRGYLVGAHQAGLTAFQIFGGTGAVGQTAEDQLNDIAAGGLGLPPAVPVPVPVPTPTPGTGLCGAPSNPYNLNYCGRGVTIMMNQVPLDICSYFTCIGTPPSNSSFWKGLGYLAVCTDGDITLSGGRSNFTCSGHGVEEHPVWQG